MYVKGVLKWMNVYDAFETEGVRCCTRNHGVSRDLVIMLHIGKVWLVWQKLSNIAKHSCNFAIVVSSDKSDMCIT